MKTIKSLFLLSIFSLSIASCDDTNSDSAVTTSAEDNSKSENVKEQALKNNFIVSGIVQEGIHAELVVETTTQQGVIVLGQTHADADGKFTIKGNIPAIGLYQLRLKDGDPKAQKSIPLSLVPEDSVHVKVNFNNFSQSPVYSGTEWAPVLNEYFNKLFAFIDFQRNLTNPQQYSQKELTNLVIKKSQPLDDFCSKSILNDSDNPANIILIQQMYPKEYLGGFENWNANNLEALHSLRDGYTSTYPKSPLTKAIVDQVNQMESGYNEYVSFSKMKKAPEIAMEDPEGKIRKLSDLRGKYVLIDFWASWCGPCRKENPNVVKLYKKYKDDGFEVFSVSLDKTKEAWKRAIKADNLIWDNHVSELNYWNSSVVQTYKFQGIPFTVLVDKNGEIIERNLRGIELENKLVEIFGK